MSHDPGCLFCRIIRGEVPSARVLETDHAVAFLDINPVNHGHTLILPRDHFATLSDLPDDLAAATAALLPRLCRAVRSATNADGLNVIVNHGDVAGQTIHHVHWHVIPRHRGDSVRWPWSHQPYAEGGMEPMRAAIARAIEDENPA